MDTYRDILLLTVLIFLSGVFSASETALTSYRSVNLENLDKDSKKAKVLRKWLKSPNEMLTGMLLGNNIVNILASSIATAVTFNVMGTSPKAIAIATVLMTVVILIFGEITPKIMAKNHAASIAEKVIIPIYYLTLITKPIVVVLMAVSKFLGRVFGVNLQDENLMITEEDIISFVNVGEAEGVIEEEEKEMIHSIVGFGETTAKEVMTPRTSMFAIEGSKTIDGIWDELMHNGFSRVPVYDETIDNVIGMLYLKDILNEVKNGNTNVEVKTLIRKAYFVPETKSIIEILDEFRAQKVHIAVVVDEYGGTVGVVTIEDLLEEIVGEIRDEYDLEEEEMIKQVGEDVYEVDAMIDIESLNKDLDLHLPSSEEYESLGGLIVKELGKVAEPGDEITIDGANLKVLKIDKMRIEKVLVEKKKEQE